MAVVDDYIDEQAYTDLIPVQPVSPMVADFEITRQMAMVAVNANGIIYHRQVMGRAEEWVPYFQELHTNPKVIPASLEAELQKEQRRKEIQLPS